MVNKLVPGNPGPQELEDGHVVLTERLVGLACTNNVSYEGWPIPRPLVLDNLEEKKKNHISNSVYEICGKLYSLCKYLD